MSKTHFSGPVVVNGKQLTDNTGITDVSLPAVTGVDGTGSNAASKADVDARLTTIETKINEIITALENAGIIQVS